MSSHPQAGASNAGRSLLTQWIAELSEFELMVRRAQHGFKKFAGGGDRWDMDLYDEEAAECARCRKVLEGLELPESAPPEEARAKALKALEEQRAQAEALGRPPPKAPYQWAHAVVDGDASRYWNAYHPRRSAAPPIS